LAVVGVGFACIGTTIASNPGDIYEDNKVDWLDLEMIVEEWLADGNTPADIDKSGDANFPDYAILANNWGWVGASEPNDMVLIPTGTFQMGDSSGDGYLDELPVHSVTLDSFYMGKYEVTNAQYCQYLNSALGSGTVYVYDGIVYGSGNGEPYCNTYNYDSSSQIDYSGVVFSVRTKGDRDMLNDPMVEVSWYGAVGYCNWRSQQEGYEICYDLSTWVCDYNVCGYRLPTEAEWEYAGRGGLSGKHFPWGDTISHNQANYYSDSSCSYDVSPTRGYHPTWNDGIYPYTCPTGGFSANGYGLYDMTGNVWEWCNDWYSSMYYSSSPPDNPTGPSSGSYRVLRGAGWYYDAGNCRLAYRYGWGGPHFRHYGFGFRLVLELD